MRYLCQIVYRLILILIVAIVLGGCHQQPLTQIRPVRAEQINAVSDSEQYSYAGVVTTYENIDLSFQVGGKIIERYVKVGDVVKPGQLLASLDTKDLLLNVRKAKEDVETAESTLALSKGDLERYKPLVKAGYVSRSFFQQAATKYETDVDVLDRAKNALELANRQLGYANLNAEYSGVITKTPAAPGQVVSAGQTVIRMARDNEKEIVINVPEQRIQQWKHIDVVAVTLWAYPEKKYSAKIHEISGEADPLTRTYTVKLIVLNPDDQMQLGMTANIQVNEKSFTQKIITLPLTAISYETEQPTVWVINMKNMTVNPVKVTLGKYENNKIVVTSGLQNGQWVVTAGIKSLRPGQKVKLLEE